VKEQGITGASLTGFAKEFADDIWRGGNDMSGVRNDAKTFVKKHLKNNIGSKNKLALEEFESQLRVTTQSIEQQQASIRQMHSDMRRDQKKQATLEKRIAELQGE
jgi:TolA-binding protein